GVVGMAIALSVLAVDRRPGGLQLPNGLLSTGIQRILHHRLLGARAASEGRLQRRIGTHPPSNLDQALGTGQQGDEGVVELVDRRVAHGLLRDVHVVADGAKPVEVLQMRAQSGQTSVRAAVLNRATFVGGTLNHGSRSFPGRRYPRKEEATVFFLSSLSGARCR